MFALIKIQQLESQYRNLRPEPLGGPSMPLLEWDHATNFYNSGRMLSD